MLQIIDNPGPSYLHCMISDQGVFCSKYMQEVPDKNFYGKRNYKIPLLGQK